MELIDKNAIDPEIYAGCGPLEIEEQLDGEPVIDARPVIHAHWVHPHWENSVSCADCSLCGRTAYHYDYHGVQENYTTCPHCGAVMDEEVRAMPSDEEWAESKLLMFAKLIKLYCKNYPAELTCSCEGCPFCVVADSEHNSCMFLKGNDEGVLPRDWKIPGEEENHETE